jgi:hypothetical protein
VNDDPLLKLFEGSRHMAYERTIDLMDESLFPVNSLYGQRSKHGKFLEVCPGEQTDDEIIEFVTKELSGNYVG